MKRRDFVMSVAATGGAAYAAMMAMNLIEPAAARTTKFQLRKPERRARVVILGAGLAGMTAAYELGKVGGYDCVILEARARSGGRCWTVRGGDVLTETDGQTQTAKLARGQYFNPGPARIPQHHVTLDYCRELGVPLEVFTNLNREQYYYNQEVGTLSSTKVRSREAVFDMYGYISELLAKSVNQNALNESLTTEDQERLIEFLRTWGGLDENLLYTGTSRRGYSVPRGGGPNPGEVAPPYDLTSLLQLGFSGYLAFESGYDQQMIMFQPVGGIDQIAKAFEKRVGRLIRFQSEIREIRKLPENAGVRVVYSDRTGQLREEIADYCICTIPLSVLKSIPSDFTPEVQEAIAAVPYASTGKIALQFNRRFWEEDENLYGGITSTNLPLTTVWYPSYGYGGKRGVIGGYYNFGTTADSFGELPPAERQALALEQGSLIHSQYNAHFENSVSTYWPKVPYSLGGWASWSEESRELYYPRLIEPDGRIYLCGEHVSYIGSWMAGAFESARYVLNQINQLN
ncbi:MAG: flavin monoamine oxidase family protein [Gemmatimonadaceae bacterium]|nr:flavin monoamine oxidase family protein [Gloeobacterales cyanobacterium ES-bin-141]